jgi:WD40 repeat protein
MPALALGGEDKVLQLWDLRSGKILRQIEGRPIRKAALTPQGTHAVIAEDGELMLWDLKSGKKVRTFLTEGAVSALSIARDGRSLLSGSEDGGL